MADITVSLLSGTLTIDPVNRGTDSAKATLKILSNVAPGGNAKKGLALVMMVENPSNPGDYVADGVPACDELWGRMEITGQDTSATPGQQIVLGRTQVMGAGKKADLPPILPGDWLIVDVWVHPPFSSGQGAGSLNAIFVIDGDEFAFPVDAGITEAARGIYSGLGVSLSFLISGLAVTQTGTPDDNANVAPGSWAIGGVGYTDASSRAANLNQNDSAAAALLAGEEYLAYITRSTSTSAVTVTKGLKASAGSSVAPTPPSGELVLALVTVSYQVGGTSVIATADISSDLTYYRGVVTYPATGLTATVHAVDALSDGFLQRRNTKTDVALTGTATNEVWLMTDGSLLVTTTTDLPAPGAHWLATLVTDGTHVTSYTDRRTFITLATTAPALHAASHGSGGSDPVSLDQSQISGLTAALALLAALADPVFTGHPSAPTQAVGDSSTDLATDAFVQRAIPYPVMEAFTGDGIATTFTLQKKPVQGNYYIDGSLSVAYGGPLVFFGDASAMVLKFPGSSADSNHYTWTGADLDILTPGVVLPIGQFALVQYFSTE